MRKQIFDENFFKSNVFDQDRGLMLKSKRMSIGTISHGMKKISEGKWRPIERNKKQEKIHTFLHEGKKYKIDKNLEKLNKETPWLSDKIKIDPNEIDNSGLLSYFKDHVKNPPWNRNQVSEPKIPIKKREIRKLNDTEVKVFSAIAFDIASDLYDTYKDGPSEDSYGNRLPQAQEYYNMANKIIKEKKIDYDTFFDLEGELIDVSGRTINKYLLKETRRESGRRHGIIGL